MGEAKDERCCKINDSGGFNSRQCSRKAVTTAPSGNKYCKQHDPEAARMRRVKARKEEHEEMLKWERETLIKKIGLIMVEAGVDTEKKAWVLATKLRGL